MQDASLQCCVLEVVGIMPALFVVSLVDTLQRLQDLIASNKWLLWLSIAREIYINCLCGVFVNLWRESCAQRKKKSQ
jgi:hypothetical protein